MTLPPVGIDCDVAASHLDNGTAGMRLAPARELVVGGALSLVLWGAIASGIMAIFG